LTGRANICAAGGGKIRRVSDGGDQNSITKLRVGGERFGGIILLGRKMGRGEVGLGGWGGKRGGGGVVALSCSDVLGYE